MSISRAYLDSSYLLALIKDEDDARDVEHMLYKLKAETFEVLVPFTVLGEVCGVVFRDYESDQDRREKIAKMVDIITNNGIQWENIKPTESKSFDIMMTLNEKDKFLDATDVMILSHVLSDPNSKFFFTTDSKILENVDIMDLEKRLRNDGKRDTPLKICDMF